MKLERNHYRGCPGGLKCKLCGLNKRKPRAQLKQGYNRAVRRKTKAMVNGGEF